MADYETIKWDFTQGALESVHWQPNAETRGLRDERKCDATESTTREERFRRIFDAAPASITVHTLPDMIYRYVNRANIATGVNPEELVGKTPWELGIWTDAEEIQQFLIALEKRGTSMAMRPRFACGARSCRL